MENVKCILCDKDDADFFIEDEEYKAVKCRRCGLIYVNPRPEFDVLKARYRDGALMEVDKHISAIEEKTLKAKLDLQLIRKWKKSGKILEIGCAEGSFLAEANKLGYEPYGIELNKRFVEYAKNKYQLTNVYECDILESPFPERYFDIIYMRNVLCHLHDPIKELNKLNEFLREDGLFICITGNLGNLSIKQIGKYSDFTPHLSQHLFHYSEANLYSLFKKVVFA